MGVSSLNSFSSIEFWGGGKRRFLLLRIHKNRLTGSDSEVEGGEGGGGRVMHTRPGESGVYYGGAIACLFVEGGRGRSIFPTAVEKNGCITVSFLVGGGRGKRETFEFVSRSQRIRGRFPGLF